MKLVGKVVRFYLDILIKIYTKNICISPSIVCKLWSKGKRDAENAILNTLHYITSLHTAQCTLHTAPASASAPAPESKYMHSIIHIEHCTLHTMYLYCTFQMYHFTLQTSKICWFQDTLTLWTIVILFQIGSFVLFLHNSHGTPQFTDCGILTGEDWGKPEEGQYGTVYGF